MDSDTKNTLGCFGIIIAALLIGVGLRSQNLTQFLVMGGLVLLGVVTLLTSVALFAQKKGWSGMGCGCIGLTAAIVVSAFLITGNYEQALSMAGSWGAASPPLAATVQVEATPTLTPQPSFTPTITLTHQPTRAIARTPATHTTPGTNDWAWSSETEIPYKQVTEALNAIWALSIQDAARKVDGLLAARETASKTGQQAIDLLIAVAHERAADAIFAHSTYTNLVSQAKDTPYAVSANFRLRVLEKPERSIQDSDALFKTIADEPESAGWFLLSGQWTWSTTRRVASHMLVDVRADELSFRFFQFLREKSPFSASYAYLFILLALTVGAKILEMPLSMGTAKAAVALRRLQPQIQIIQNIYSSDPMAMNQSLMELYKAHGVNVWGGCGVVVVDLIFVIWAMFALGSFTPQMILDGAQFFWVADVTQPDFLVLLIWGVISIIQSIATTLQQVQQIGQQSIATTACSVLVAIAIFIAIAWFWKWPAYVLIFWILLTIVGLVITSVLNWIVTVTE